MGSSIARTGENDGRLDVFNVTHVVETNSSGYPAPFRDNQRKRWTRRLGDYGGLKNCGANLTRVEPGGQSSARHAHTKQDEFVYVTEGELVLVTDAGRQTVRPGTGIRRALEVIIF